MRFAERSLFFVYVCAPNAGSWMFLAPLNLLLASHALNTEGEPDTEGSRAIASLPVVASWLQDASHGYCGETQSGDVGDCEVGLFGSWALSKREASSWESAVRTCLRHCDRCNACRFVSITIKQQDCSWYTRCHVLRTDVTGFRTGPGKQHARFSTSSVTACTAPPLLESRPGGIDSATGTVLLPPELMSPGYSNLPMLTSTAPSTTHARRAVAEGEWSTEEWARRTRRNYNLLDYGLLRAVRSLFPCHIDSVLDFGAGGGHYSAALQCLFGASRVYGVEPNNMSSLGLFAASEDAGPVQSMADFATSDYRPGALPFDLVWSTEVLEHVPYEAQCRILNALALSSRRWVIFSAGTSWHGGKDNRGPRPSKDWELQWISRGFQFDTNRTCALRAAATKGWFKHGALAVYERVVPCSLACSSRRCADNGFTGERIDIGSSELRSHLDEDITRQLCAM